MRYIEALGLVSLLFLGACSPSNSANSQTSTTASQACNEFATNFCTRLASCSDFNLKTLFGTVNACQTRMEPICLSVLNAPGTGYTPQKYQACAQAYASANCDAMATYGFRPAECQVTGTLAAGSACGDGAQCQTGYCTMDYFTVCGVCADPVKAGGQCSKSDQCEIGLDCYSPGTCEASATQGESCTQVGCVSGTSCVNSVCVAKLAAGATCDASNSNCDLWLTCDPSTLKCVERPSAALNASCANGETCEASGICNSTTATCQPAAADGASCDLSNTQPCQYPAQCINNVCVRPDATACH